MRKRKKYRLLSAVLAVVLAIAPGMATLASAKTGTSSEEIGAEGSLAEQLQKKYAGDGAAYTYGDPIYNLGRSEAITLELGFNPKEKGMEYYTEIATLYKDAALTQEVLSSYEAPEDYSKVEIQPPRSGDLTIWNSGLARDEYGIEENETTLFKKEEYQDWGNIGKFYMAVYVDLETGEALEKPVVSVVTVKGELDAPEIKFQETDEGIAAFTWEPVEGVKKYMVVQFDDSEEQGPHGWASVIGETTDTHWEYEVLSGDTVINSKFNIATVSEDDWNDENMIDYYIEEYGEEARGTVVESILDPCSYGVIAINEEGTSMISNSYAGKDLASLLVYTEAFYTSAEERTNYPGDFAHVPTYRWVIMCDGRLVQKLVNYDTDKAKEEKTNWIYYEDDENYSDAEVVEVDIVSIPYKIEGTPFGNMLYIEEYEKDAVDSELKTLAERQESLQVRTGNVETKVTRLGEAGERKGASLSAKDMDKKGKNITANSALSEYLAIHMLAGEEDIDISEFKESSDQEYLVNAISEARYQNPLILGISNMWVSRDGKTLVVEYEDKEKEREKKQEELSKAVDKIVAKIIDDKMTDLEKEIAINQYLCETAEYDYDALENAAKYDYMKVDAKYYDSFTAYGVLINEIGVCASYAAAFKLLADATGLESIVVTGYLEGSLSHAWNRVNIEGEWRTLDATNNDNDELPNALLNLSDRAAKKVLVEDEDYVMDSVLKKYTSTTDALEYYRVEGKYFDVEKISAELASELDENSIAILRTDYDLNDSVFKKILLETSDKATKKPTAGYYWMGVIYLECI